MKRKQLAAWMLTAALVTVPFGGVTAGADAAVSAAEVVSAAEEVTEERIIGTEAEGDDILVLELLNGTGKNIKGFQVKNIYRGEYPDSLIAEDDLFEADEQRTLYFDTDPEHDASDESAAESMVENTVSEEKEKLEYNLKITFDDDSTKSITMFPFDDMEEGVLLMTEDGTLYVDYISLKSGEEKNTIGTEAAYREAKRAAEEAAAAAAAARSRRSSGSRRSGGSSAPAQTAPSNNGGGAEECIDDDAVLY